MSMNKKQEIDVKYRNEVKCNRKLTEKKRTIVET